MCHLQTVKRPLFQLGMASSLTILHCVLVLSSAVMLGCQAACPQDGNWERVPGTPQYYCYTLLNVSEGVFNFWVVSRTCRGLRSSTVVTFNNKVRLPIFNQFVLSENIINTDYLFRIHSAPPPSSVGLYFLHPQAHVLISYTVTCYITTYNL